LPGLRVADFKLAGSTPGSSRRHQRKLTCQLRKRSSGVIVFTTVFAAARYTSLTSARSHLRSQVPNNRLNQPSRRTAMTKLVLAAVAALSILASPALAGPGGSWDDIVAKSGDFQMQGR